MAGRPPTPIGALGEISCTEVAPGKFRARARYRDITGTERPIGRTRDTEAKARNAVKAAHIALMDQKRGGKITPMTPIPVIAESWYTDFEARVAAGERSANSMRNYRGYLDNHILPAVKNLRHHEATTTAWQEFFTAKRAGGMKFDALRSMRSVASSINDYAIQHSDGGITHNPIDAMRDIERGESDEVEIKAMTTEQILYLRQKLFKRARAVKEEIPDLMDGMLSTGVRIGEILAGIDTDWHPAAKTENTDKPIIEINFHIVREKGKGLLRKRSTKNGTTRMLYVPTWSAPMWTRRTLAARPGGPLFASPDGGWRDPSNTLRTLREEFDQAGFAWVTSHVWRKTVGTVLSEAGLGDAEVGDQLGNTARVARNYYISPRKPRNAKQAEILEGIMTQTNPCHKRVTE